MAAIVTHAHPDGIDGGVAVALAAAWVCRWDAGGRSEPPQALIAFVADRLADREMSAALQRAAEIDPADSAYLAAERLGNGVRLTALDTVPFCLWCAARHLTDYETAIWETISVGGDFDTNAAIVGGVVACAVGVEGIPELWRRSREGLWILPR